MKRSQSPDDSYLLRHPPTAEDDDELDLLSSSTGAACSVCPLALLQVVPADLSNHQQSPAHLQNKRRPSPPSGAASSRSKRVPTPHPTGQPGAIPTPSASPKDLSHSVRLPTTAQTAQDDHLAQAGSARARGKVVASSNGKGKVRAGQEGRDAVRGAAAIGGRAEGAYKMKPSKADRAEGRFTSTSASRTTAPRHVMPPEYAASAGLTSHAGPSSSSVSTVPRPSSSSQLFSLAAAAPHSDPPRPSIKQLRWGSPLARDDSSSGAEAEAEALRRPHRNRVQPLEYWRNERMLYKKRQSELMLEELLRVPEPEKETFARLKRKEKRREQELASIAAAEESPAPSSSTASSPRRPSAASKNKTRSVELDLVVERAKRTTTPRTTKERSKNATRDKLAPAPTSALAGAPLPSPALTTAVPSPHLAAAPSRTPLQSTSTSSSTSSTFIPTPSLSHFLTTLPISLTHLTPIFASFGCTTPADLLALASPTEAGVRARSLMLDLVSKKVAQQKSSARRTGMEEQGLSTWERIVLEEELRAGWRVWTEAQAEEAAGRV